MATMTSWLDLVRCGHGGGRYQKQGQGIRRSDTRLASCDGPVREPAARRRRDWLAPPDRRCRRRRDVVRDVVADGIMAKDLMDGVLRDLADLTRGLQVVTGRCASRQLVVGETGLRRRIGAADSVADGVATASPTASLTASWPGTSWTASCVTSQI